ncbi:nuclear transport factor 2 family protein [Vibrio vulnificus]|uniref:nuclear transport factor 2 family protein n=1 Tax=Vibrio vulnificus TaxID=672 RepID=UPI000C7A9A45|nr:nuclear transport factor 2 family protein [Vibrio vulnificus]AUL95263.1 Putative transcriptional regulator [Vibrio vulnificus]EGQ7834094.1 nuclear transport factor 2 family protein [Vibrio vulnificus]EGQ7940031.1 nuclear transport factor 2 family protein [Vibrio vulnificus]EHH0681949.1 nuclear transport factor 2 family protein [Vibrio vulnificus]EHH0709281.1 nuclear transport factor 2 family protein [Vibrio vulnificus]
MDVIAVSNVYQSLSKSNLEILADVYHQQVVFEDAAHRLEGWSALKDYFQSLYENVIDCRFDIHEHQQVDQSGFLTWTMTLKHPKLKKGEAVSVKGVSHLKFHEGKVIYHRDYFDLGEMLYEHLPILGSVVRAIKQRLGQ